jgi:hypothetical protein
MKTLLFLIVSTLLFSCAKHEDAQLYIQCQNVKTLSLNGDENTLYQMNAVQDTEVYLMAKTNEKIQFSSSPVNTLLPFKFDVYQTINGVDIRIIHINSESNGEFKTEK